jgi:hypothetical protein
VLDATDDSDISSIYEESRMGHSSPYHSERDSRGNRGGYGRAADAQGDVVMAALDADEKRRRNTIASQAYRDRNREVVRARALAYYHANKERRLEQAAKYRKVNKERLKAVRLERRRNDPTYAANMRRWNTESRLRNIEASRARCAAKYRNSSPEQKLKHNSLSMIRQSLIGYRKNRPWHEAVGYSVDELKAHLERQFTKGMSWDNYGQWHVDHIRPLSSFSYTSVDDPEFKECWALTNLRPMWAADNISKNNRRTHLL